MEKKLKESEESSTKQTLDLKGKEG